MKKILPVLLVTVLLLSCSRVERIQSLSQLEPALRKHVGNPNKIDTVYKGDIFPMSGIHYEYDSVPKVKFEDLVDFLSKAYDATPVITIDLPRRKAWLVPLKDDSGAYMIQVSDYWDGDVKERQLGFFVIDVNNELVTPSSQT
ncbi:hypothetical protein, partial [Parabacteroides sp. AM08-6]|uniref:hypothetical protein n=1 Tax=Parabacteroides sp. AM08-6 TaxID=2292053 RepID=UPI0018F688EA